MSVNQLQDSSQGADNLNKAATVLSNTLMVVGGNRLNGYDITNGLVSAATQTFAQGQGLVHTLSGAAVSATSPDGRFLYAYSPADKGLGLYDRTTQSWTTVFDGGQVPIGVLMGVPSIVVSQSGTDYYALVVNPATGAYTEFKTTTTDTTSRTTPVRYENRSYLVGCDPWRTRTARSTSPLRRG